jgi:hypothetical protein
LKRSYLFIYLFRHVEFLGENRVHVIPPIFIAGSCPIYFDKCLFCNFSFNFGIDNIGGIFYLVMSSFTVVNECVIRSIYCYSNHTVIFCTPSESISGVRELHILDSNISNITSNGSSVGIGCICHVRYMTLNSTNVSYVNIRGENGYSGGVFFVENQSIITLDLKGCSFVEVACMLDGGALCTASASRFVLRMCVFEKCVSLNGKGGAVFIASTGALTYSYCKFLNNYAENGANDVDHSYNIQRYYGSVDFSGTCSDSPSPRILFPNGISLDNFLEGMRKKCKLRILMCLFVREGTFFCFVLI